MDNLFVILFKDNEKYNGGIDYKNTGWMEIPDKEIRTLFYRLPSGDHLILNNYNKYFHMIEAVQDLYNGKNRIEYAYIMGKIGNTVRVFKIDIHKNIGNIETKEYDEQDNFVKKLNSNIWKKGI